MERRKRMKRREVEGAARYLTFSCEGRLPLLGSSRWRDFMAETIESARSKCGFALLAWVVMPEHVHIIIVSRDPANPVSKATIAIKQPVAQHAISAWTKARAPILERIRIGEGRHRYWLKGGGFDRSVRDEYELGREIRYIHMNPVRRGLVRLPTEWPWSSARAYAGRSDAMLPLDSPEIGVMAIVQRHLELVERGRSSWGMRRSDFDEDETTVGDPTETAPTWSEHQVGGTSL